MQQTLEATAFLNRIAALPPGPGVLLNEALQPSLDDETELRRLFATDKMNQRLKDPHVGLVDVFNAPDDIRRTRARVVADDEDLSTKYVMPLAAIDRRAEGAPCMVNDLDEFKKNWAIFTEGALSQLQDWSGVVAAGGAVLACVTPLPEKARVSKRAVRKHYHTDTLPTSDVDLFLWGMTPEQAEVKINAIYEAVRDSVPWDVTCVRTKHTVSIHSQYPYRSIQIVLRLYSSPAEILAGFDIDAPCCAYDGQHVYANPRAIVAMMRQCNTVDMTRRSPSYEVRLAKYAGRAFEVYVPTLKRMDVDPTIYERSIARITGLARLLVLEKLTDTDTRLSFLEHRRTLRGRPNPLNRYNKYRRKLKGDLKADTTVGGLEMNDYDVASLHIPYGPGWDARRIEKLVYQTDLGMNSTFNPKNKGRRLHRHPAFFGTMSECLDDCCEQCPDPIDEDERKLQEKESENYIRGRIAFIQENPGRQTLSGSFNPIDVGEWSAQTYVQPTQLFFSAIAANDRPRVQQMIADNIDVNHRDHVGRAPLHVAILCKAEGVACDLVDSGARMSARLVDGRTALHLAAEGDLVEVVKKLLERSAENEEAEKEKMDGDEDEKMDGGDGERERASEEDDWSSEEEDGKGEGDEDDEAEGEDEDESDEEDSEDSNGNPRKKKKAPSPPASEVAASSGDLPEDDPSEPDILDLNLPCWDRAFTPLAYAVLFASTAVVQVLVAAGADVKKPTSAQGYGAIQLHPLALTILREDEDTACEIAERFLAVGASSGTADEQLRTIFYSAVCAERVKLVSTLLRCDPGAKDVLNFPAVLWADVVFPLSYALAKGNYAMIAVLLAYGAKLDYTEEDVMRAQEAVAPSKRQGLLGYGITNYLDQVYKAAETAIAKYDDVIQLLLALGAPASGGIKSYLGRFAQLDSPKTLLDWIVFAIGEVTKEIEKKEEPVIVDIEMGEAISEWKAYLKNHRREVEEASKPAPKKDGDEGKQLQQLKDMKMYLVEVERLLLARGAKTWNEVYPDPEKPAANVRVLPTKAKRINTAAAGSDTQVYRLLSMGFGGVGVPQHLNAAYDDLYEACYTGDSEKIQQLCLPAETTAEKLASPRLEISVSTMLPENNYMNEGYTPLFAAICGRRWSTAKLIMAIAAAQYQPDSPGKEVKFKLDLDSDSDDGSEDSDASDETIEQEEIKFVDVATRPSAVKSNAHPKQLIFDTSARYTRTRRNSEKFVGQGNRESGKVFEQSNLLTMAVSLNDLEAFVNIANLYESFGKSLDLDTYLLDWILTADNPDIMDEYIRRTGTGIIIPIAPKGNEEDLVTAVNDQNKTYLGLNVHGKKRTDLASKNDPSAHRNNVYEIPLLWNAASQGAKAIVEYLAGERPLAAYRFFASSQSTERALRVRRAANLESVLPVWLGWTVNHLGESPLTAILLGGPETLDVIKILFSKSSRLMTRALGESLKFVGYDPLLLAVSKRCRVDIIQFLLDKGLSPAGRDQIRGWNIYHFLCEMNNGDLLEYFLGKLPREVNEALLTQQSKERQNTPLHIAVKTGAKRPVKLLLDYTKSTLLLRDVNGCIPLHAGVTIAYQEITKLLTDASSESLYMENGVGKTALEIVAQQELSNRLTKFTNCRNEKPLELNRHSFDLSSRPRRYEFAELHSNLLQLRRTIEELTNNGKLKKKTKLAWELNNFATMMESRLSEVKKAEEAQKAPLPVEDQKNEKDGVDVEKIREHILNALSASSGSRRLIHLIDVQKSVEANLAQLKVKHQNDTNDEDGLEPEDDPDASERLRSSVFRSIPMQGDRY